VLCCAVFGFGMLPLHAYTQVCALLLQDVLGLLDRCAQQQQQQQQPGSAWTGAAAAVAAYDRLGPPPNLDWLDVDYPGDPPKQKGDTVAHKYPLLRVSTPAAPCLLHRQGQHLHAMH
jgi:hypothetical protein